MTSPIVAALSPLAGLPPDVAHARLDELLDVLPVHELAAIGYDWRWWWARPRQVLPDDGWRSFGSLGGRGSGKTRISVSFALDEIAAGRAMRVAAIAQSELDATKIFVQGETGFLELAPPWLAPQWEATTRRIVFANGASVMLYTAQEPGGLRGHQHHLGLASEIAAWPKASAEAAMFNLDFGLRLGYGRLVWDSTPRARNPLIRERLALAKADPTHHRVEVHPTRDNMLNLTAGAVALWESQYAGTRTGAEELEGTYFDDAEDAIFKSAWWDKTRRALPEKLKRRILSVDPAITKDSRHSDSTGIVDMGLGVDDQILVIENRSGKHAPEVWPGMVVDAYVRGGCDLILAETNRGGDLVVALLRVAVRDRGLALVELGDKEIPGARAGVVYVRARNAKRSKVVRAGPAAALCERGRVTFIVGALGDLEDRLCSFDGSEGKPDDAVDAFVHGVYELAQLGHEAVDPAAAFAGLAQMQAALRGGAPPATSLTRPRYRGGMQGGGRRI